MPLKYEVVIGLEVHVELSTASKIFCGCATDFGASPNTQVCPVCLGLPGSLPVLNYQALRLAMRAALALECRIAETTKFDRKNYFYPDLPKAYQISQYDLPLAASGQVIIETPSGEKCIRILRVHMEEDAGKLIHLGQGGQIGAADSSLVDYNRAGIPLIEIVSEPDLRSPEEAYTYLVALKEIMQHTQVSECNMEQGQLRCDANISVRPLGQKSYGTKIEIKNMNSFKHVRASLAYESQRQIQRLQAGEAVIQETRLWDGTKEITYPMRSKEEAQDYRYFPEPDLPMFSITPEMVAAETKALPELPRSKRQRFMQTLGLSAYAAGVLTSSPPLADFFSAALAAGNYNTTSFPKALCNWLTVELIGLLNADGRSLADSPIAPGQLARLVSMVESEKISGKMGKQVFATMYATGKDPETIIQEQGLSQITDPKQIIQWIDQVIQAHPGPVADYRQGKIQSIGFLVGQVMQASQGKANPKLVQKILKKRLEQDPSE